MPEIIKVLPPSSDTTPTVTQSDFVRQDAKPAPKAPKPSALSAVKKSQPAKVEAPVAEPANKPEAADGSPAAKPEAAKKPADERLERLNRMEARNRQRDQELKETKDQLSKLQLTAKDLDVIKELSKTDRAAMFKKLGLELNTQMLEQIAEDYLKQGKVTGDKKPAADPKSDALLEVQKKLEAMEQERIAVTTLAQQQHNVKQFIDPIAAIISNAADPTTYELTVQRAALPASNPKLFGDKATEEAVQLAEAAFAETGQWLSPQQVADSLEAYYEREAEAEFTRLTVSKKLQKKFGLTKAEATAAIDAAKAEEPAKKAAPTLGGRQLHQTPTVGKEKVKIPPGMSVLAFTKQQLAAAKR